MWKPIPSPAYAEWLLHKKPGEVWDPSKKKNKKNLPATERTNSPTSTSAPTSMVPGSSKDIPEFASSGGYATSPVDRNASAGRTRYAFPRKPGKPTPGLGTNLTRTREQIFRHAHAEWGVPPPPPFPPTPEDEDPAHPTDQTDPTPMDTMDELQQQLQDLSTGDCPRNPPGRCVAVAEYVRALVEGEDKAACFAMLAAKQVACKRKTSSKVHPEQGPGPSSLVPISTTSTGQRNQMDIASGSDNQESGREEREQVVGSKPTSDCSTISSGSRAIPRKKSKSKASKGTGAWLYIQELK